MKTKNKKSRRVLEENRKLKKQNRELLLTLEKSVSRHRKWEQIASCFHDTLWQVLLKYDPDTYGEICPDRDVHTEGIDLETLPKLQACEMADE